MTASEGQRPGDRIQSPHGPSEGPRGGAQGWAGDLRAEPAQERGSSATPAPSSHYLADIRGHASPPSLPGAALPLQGQDGPGSQASSRSKELTTVGHAAHSLATSSLFWATPGASPAHPLAHSLGSSQKLRRFRGAWYAPEVLPTPDGTGSPQNLLSCLATLSCLQTRATQAAAPGLWPAHCRQVPRYPQAEGTGKSHPPSPGSGHGPRCPNVPNTTLETGEAGVGPGQAQWTHSPVPGQGQGSGTQCCVGCWVCPP